MQPSPYRRFQNRALTLADHLAIDRTVLANERTGLAYARTALAIAVVGGTCIKFFESRPMWVLGICFIATSVVVATVGWRRFRRTRRYLADALDLQTAAADRPHPLQE
ncbi:MAG: DUF202 domain-containing protein [Phycisphaerales bacterium]|nr:DUF202 domain-containing protein [Phycisphaerales bacterium]